MTETDDFPLATDLADLDGDGDLDWVTSSFFGDWLLFENRGGGTFRLANSFPAPEAASCSLPMDLDNETVCEVLRRLDGTRDREALLRDLDGALDAAELEKILQLAVRNAVLIG